MTERLRQFWLRNGPRITVGSIFIGFVVGVATAVLFPDNELAAGLVGLMFASVFAVICFGDLVTGTTAAKDGNNENITLSKNPIQYCLSIGIQLLIITFVVWVSITAIASAISTAG